MIMFANNSPLILAISTFTAIILLYLAVSSFLAARQTKKDIGRRAARLSGNIDRPEPGILRKEKNTGKGLLSFFRFGKNRKKEDTSIYADTPIFYQRAGIYNSSTIRFYQVMRVSLLLAPLVLLFISYLASNRPLNAAIVIGIIALSYIGYILPLIWLRIVAAKRKKELNRTFPDAMDLLMVCVEAGMGIDSAIRRVSQEIHTTSPELGKEMKILSLELKTGRSRNSCLKNLARRADLPDVENLVSLLIQADKYGTGVTQALKIHAEEMRQKRYSKLEELAAKLPVKLTIPMILFIFPAFFVVIAGPAAIQVLRIIIQG